MSPDGGYGRPLDGAADRNPAEGGMGRHPHDDGGFGRDHPGMSRQHQHGGDGGFPRDPTGTGRLPSPDSRGRGAFAAMARGTGWDDGGGNDRRRDSGGGAGQHQHRGPPPHERGGGRHPHHHHPGGPPGGAERGRPPSRQERHQQHQQHQQGTYASIGDGVRPVRGVPRASSRESGEVRPAASARGRTPPASATASAPPGSPSPPPPAAPAEPRSPPTPPSPPPAPPSEAMKALLRAAAMDADVEFHHARLMMLGVLHEKTKLRLEFLCSEGGEVA